MSHVLIAVSLQAMFGLIGGRWWLGAIAATIFFIGREITQAEYRWIAAYGHGRRANMPWWGGFDPAAWNLKSLTDMLLPALVTVLIASFMTLKNHRQRKWFLKS